MASACTMRQRHLMNPPLTHRDLCAKLHLKAESQEIDRILEGFSARYYDCNPATVFGTPGLVHTVTAAMLMLNTDLHIADLQKHMSRADFVRNAMRAIQESMPGDRGSTPDLIRDDSGSVRLGSSSVSFMQPSGAEDGSTNGNGASVRHRPGPSSILTAPRSASAPVVTSPHPPLRGDSERSLSGVGSGSIADRARTSAPTPAGSAIYGKAWEGEAENALKVCIETEIVRPG
jgi:PH/SEC7 domain-containing protein